ncbi:hypothetical protein TorRG33x02_055570, partial [Trema orientale]
VHGGIIRESHYLANYADSFLVESHATCGLNKSTSGEAKNDDVKWTAPLPGEFTLNLDATVRKGDNFIGIGMVIRDHRDVVVAALSKHLQ